MEVNINLKKQLYTNKKLEITINNKNLNIGLINIPETDRFILQTKNDYLTLFAILSYYSMFPYMHILSTISTVFTT